jgi:uncharacterized repeat protein (TIGR02543 family)
MKMYKKRIIYVLIFIIFTLGELALLLVLGINNHKVGNFTVDFKANGGSEVSSVVVKEGTTLESSLISNKTGFIFLGWYTDEGFLHSFDFRTPIHTNLTLYARWELIPGTNLYRVIWAYEDGRILEDDREVVENTTPTFDSITPILESTNQYEYLFVGWSPTIQPATQDVIYYAQFISQPRKYNITWVVDEQVTLIQYHVNYGTALIYSGLTPIKAASAQYTYTFVGWDLDGDLQVDELSTLTGNTTLVAIFSSSLRTYTITWLVDGIVQETDTNVAYGTTPSYDGQVPTRTSSSQWDYLFNGSWSPAVSNVVADATYEALFLAIARAFNVEFRVEGVLKESLSGVAYGSSVVYSGATPTKAATVEYTYTFLGWDGPDSNSEVDDNLIITADTLYQAVFLETLRNYSVTWKASATTILYIDNSVPYGTIPTYSGITPTKPSSVSTNFTFNGTWSPAVAAISGDTTYLAQYDESSVYYLISWVNYDGLNGTTTTSVAYGALPVAPSVTLAANTDQYIYSAGTWGTIGVCSGPATYTYVANRTLQTYLITWVNYDGLYGSTTSEVAYGTLPVAPSVTLPVNTAEYTYSAGNWGTIEICSGPATYTYQPLRTTNLYAVTWKSDASTIIKIDYVAYGEIPYYGGATPSKAASNTTIYTFNGTWSPSVAAITGNTTYLAGYNESIRYYQVTWAYGSSSLTDTYQYQYNETFAGYNLGQAITKASDAMYDYSFTGQWSPELPATITANITFMALFTPTLRAYSITWMILPEEDLSVVETYFYGETPHLDTVSFNLNHYTYSIVGWNQVITCVVGDATYYAQYTTVLETFPVTWNIEDQLTTEMYTYGSVPYYLGGSVPYKDGDEQYYYIFAGWSTSALGSVVSIDPVTQEITYYALFTQHLLSYQVQFFNEDGDLLKTTYVPYGTTGSALAPLTLEVPDAQYFYQWEVEGVLWEESDSIVANLLIQANFSSIFSFEEFNSELTLMQIINYDQYAPSGRYHEITIPQSNEDGYLVKYLSSNLFGENGASVVVSIVVPDSVIYIDGNAFNGVGNLKNITLPFVGVSREATDELAILGVIFGNSYFNLSTFVSPFYYPLIENIIITNDDNLEANAINLSSIKNISLNEGITSFGQRSLAGLINLEHLNFPSTLLTIEAMALYNCRKLAEVILPNGLAFIGQQSFGDLVSLRNIVIPGSVVTIDDYAFAGDSLLSSIILENGIINIGNRAFKDLPMMTHLTIPNSINSLEEAILEGDYNIASLEIPFIGSSLAETNTLTETLGYLFGGTWQESYATHFYEANNYPLPFNLTAVKVNLGTYLDNYAFLGASSLRIVELPSTLEEIGPSAFNSCTNLNSLILPSTLRTIDYEAFSGCQALSSLNFPDQLEDIGSNAFYETGLISIVLPDSLINLGFYAFAHSLQLRAVVIGDGLTYIGDSAFASSPNLISVTFGNQIELINTQAFFNCSSLTNLAFPNSLSLIGQGAFMGTAIVSLVLPNAVISIDDGAFANCENLRSIYISDYNAANLYIGSGLLQGDRSLERIRIPFIGDRLDNSYFTLSYLFGNSPLDDVDFYEANGKIPNRLRQVEIGEFETILPDNAFRNLSSLTSVILGTNIVEIRMNAFDGCLNLISLVIPSSVELIGNYAFAFCENITSLVIPDSVNSLGANAYTGMRSLASLTIPYLGTSFIDGLKFSRFFDSLYSNPDFYSINYGTGDNHSIPLSLKTVILTGGEQIIASGFEGFTSLVNIILPNGLKEIGFAGFSNCTSLETIYIPNSVTSIATLAFFHCISLRTIHLPSGLTSLSSSIFSDCFSLQAINIPSSVTSIGDLAFSNCSALESLVLPSSLLTIGYKSFAYCASVTSLTIPNSVTSIDYFAFQDMLSLQTLTVPWVGRHSSSFLGNSTIHDLFGQESTHGGTYQALGRYIPYSLTKVVITIGNYNGAIYSIPAHAFDHLTQLETIIYPASIARIFEYAFAYIKGQPTMTISDSVVQIEQYAFSSIANLSTIIIGSSVVGIPDYAFYLCGNLTSVVFRGNNVSEIRQGAFALCVSLVYIHIPSSVVMIYQDAFNSCFALSSFIVHYNIYIYANAFSDFDLIVHTLTIYTDATNIMSWPQGFNIHYVTGLTLPA